MENLKNITRQSLPNSEYTYLLGACVWVHNSNMQFIKELICKEYMRDTNDVSWFELICGMSDGQLLNYKNAIKTKTTEEIYNKINHIIEMRNWIFHSTPSGEIKDNTPIAIYRNDSKKINKEITLDFMKKFIKENEELSSLIYQERDHKMLK